MLSTCTPFLISMNGKKLFCLGVGWGVGGGRGGVGGGVYKIGTYVFDLGGATKSNWMDQRRISTNRFWTTWDFTGSQFLQQKRQNKDKFHNVSKNVMLHQRQNKDKFHNVSKNVMLHQRGFSCTMGNTQVQGNGLW